MANSIVEEQFFGKFQTIDKGYTISIEKEYLLLVKLVFK